MKTRTSDLIVRILESPELLRDLVSRTGLTSGYVASELRRFRKFLDGETLTGRLAISYRVARELIKMNQALAAWDIVGLPTDDNMDSQLTAGIKLVEHVLPSQGDHEPDRFDTSAYVLHSKHHASMGSLCRCEECVSYLFEHQLIKTEH